ncbi:MAG: hypothetical protein FD155_445 [Bacteroidetes bacterium]|nr:MAG: hypothetical protein FD155_445 [Bacteroidota bacterium]
MKKKEIKQDEIVYTDEQSVNEKITFLENEARKVNEFAATFERYFNEKLSNENFRQLSNEKAIRSRYYDLMDQDIKNLNVKGFSIVETMKMNMVSHMNVFFEEVQTIKEALKQAVSFKFEDGVCSVTDDAKVDIYKKNSIVLSSEASKKAYQAQLEIMDAVNKYIQVSEKYFKNVIIGNPELLLSKEIAKFDPVTNRFEYIPLNFEKALRIINYKE